MVLIGWQAAIQMVEQVDTANSSNRLNGNATVAKAVGGELRGVPVHLKALPTHDESARA